jgi:hypothetical protein
MFAGKAKFNWRLSYGENCSKLGLYKTIIAVVWANLYQSAISTPD